MSRIGFVGLGIMGSRMAPRLIRAGHEVAAFNRSPAPTQRLAELGGRPADSVADACRDAEFVITMLPDSPDVEAVALAADGILATCSSDAVYLDMSTVRPATARTLYDRGAERGIAVLDAPVSGGDQAAADGKLSIMVGGPGGAFTRAEPILRVLGSSVVHVGPAGAGQTVKAVNQLVVGGIIELVSEAIVLLEAVGVDPEVALGVLAAGLAGNRVIDRKGAAMLERRFEPGFRIDLHHKDLGIVLEVAREAEVAIPLGAQVAQLMEWARAQGDGGLDHTALLRLVERLSGRGGAGTSPVS